MLKKKSIAAALCSALISGAAWSAALQPEGAPLGTHTYQLEVNDGKSNPVTDRATITVYDTTPPNLTLWNPSLQLVKDGTMQERVVSIATSDNDGKLPSLSAVEQVQTEESEELCCEETEGMTDDDTEGAKNDSAEEEDTKAELSDDYVILRSCKIIMSYLKDPHSFVLLKYKVSGEKYRKVVTIEYTATNSYGGRVRTSAILEFDPQGNARFVY